MNPKSEFVKAIMSVLRLESNIYTTGAIETIIERLEVTDYQQFIAYLGERNSDYEKPIENIAKGVQEYCEIKELPVVEYAEQMTHSIHNIFKNTRTYYGSNQEWGKFLEFKKDNEIFENLKDKNSQEVIYTDEIIDIIFNIGLEKINVQIDRIFVDYEPIGDDRLFRTHFKFSFIYQYLTKDLTKSIAEKITHNSDTKKLLSIEEIKSKALLISRGSKDATDD